MIMRFEWDEAKRRLNFKRHGIDFADVEIVFAGEAITIFDDRFPYGEERFLTIGLLWGRLVSVAHTETDDAVRIISARKSTKNEEIIYFKEIKN
jgi:uncharacterized DUF497 family protein